MKDGFKEWLESRKCNDCETPVDMGWKALSGGDTNRLLDVNGEKVKGYYCRDCYPYALANLMNERFVESYNGNHHFHKDGMYFPYWGAGYHFKDIEGCRLRSDSPTAILGGLL